MKQRMLGWAIAHILWAVTVLAAVWAGSESSFCSATAVEALPVTSSGPFGSRPFFESLSQEVAEFALLGSCAAAVIALIVTNIGGRAPGRLTVTNVVLWVVGATFAFFAMAAQFNQPAFCAPLATLSTIFGLGGIVAVTIYANSRLLQEVKPV